MARPCGACACAGGRHHRECPCRADIHLQKSKQTRHGSPVGTRLVDQPVDDFDNVAGLHRQVGDLGAEALKPLAGQRGRQLHAAPGDAVHVDGVERRSGKGLLVQLAGPATVVAFVLHDGQGGRVGGGVGTDGVVGILGHG